MFIGNWYVRPAHAALLVLGCAGLLAFLALVVGPRLSVQLEQLVTSASAQMERVPDVGGEQAVEQVLQVNTFEVPLVGDIPVALSGTVQLEAPGQPVAEEGSSFLYVWHTQPSKELVEYYRLQYQVAGWEVSRPTFDADRGSTVIVVSNEKWKAFLTFSDAPAGQAPVKGILQGTFHPLDSDLGPDLSQVAVPEPPAAAAPSTAGSPAGTTPGGTTPAPGGEQSPVPASSAAPSVPAPAPSVLPSAG